MFFWDGGRLGLKGWLGWVGLMGGGEGMELVEEVVDEGDLDYFLGLFS